MKRNTDENEVCPLSEKLIEEIITKVEKFFFFLSIFFEKEKKKYFEGDKYMKIIIISLIFHLFIF